MARLVSTASVLLVVICLLHMASAYAYLEDPNDPDTVLIGSDEIPIPGPASLSVTLVSDEVLDGVEITLAVTDAAVIVDSFSIQPGVLTDISFHGVTYYGNTATIFAYSTTSDFLLPGRHLLGRLHVSYADTITPRTVLVDTMTLYLDDSLIVRTTELSMPIQTEAFVPTVSPGHLDVLPRCCNGVTGDCNCSGDAINLSDITRLIDRVYISHTPLCCEHSGNTNGDPEGQLTLADITRLIDFVYVSGTPTAPCP